MNSNQELLRMTIAASVPIEIEHLRRQGGITDWHLEKLQDFGFELGAKADLLMYGSSRKGETAQLMTRLCQAIAVMAFVPGGVNFCGDHYEAVSESEVA